MHTYNNRGRQRFAWLVVDVVDVVDVCLHRNNHKKAVSVLASWRLRQEEKIPRHTPTQAVTRAMLTK